MNKTFQTFFIISIFLFVNTAVCIFTVQGEDVSDIVQKGTQKLNSKEYVSAIAYLKKALKIFPSNTQVKQLLAISLNNRALELQDEGRIDEAITLLEEAVELYDSETGRENLSKLLHHKATILYNNQNLTEALKYTKLSLGYWSKTYNALLLTGKIYYDFENLDKAMDYFLKAQKLNPNDKKLSEAIQKVKNEKSKKKKFKKIPSAKFVIRYDDKKFKIDQYKFRNLLREAYRIIGQDLGLFPSDRIVAILYSPESYKSIKGLPPQVTGLFDGKIHIPLRENVSDIKQYKAIVYHEYTHALIHNISKGRCPTWLNEGIAKYEESRIMTPDLKILKTAIKNKSLLGPSNLDKVFYMILHKRQLTKNDIVLIDLAYEESYTLAKYLLNRYRRAHIQKMLKAFARGKSLDEVLRSELRTTSEKLQKEWIKYIKGKYL